MNFVQQVLVGLIDSLPGLDTQGISYEYNKDFYHRYLSLTTVPTTTVTRQKGDKEKRDEEKEKRGSWRLTLGVSVVYRESEV